MGAGTAIAYVAPVIWGAFVPMMGRITAIRVTFTIMAAVAFVCMLVPPLAIREKDYVNSQPTSESTIESLKQTFATANSASSYAPTWSTGWPSPPSRPVCRSS